MNAKEVLLRNKYRNDKLGTLTPSIKFIFENYKDKCIKWRKYDGEPDKRVFEVVDMISEDDLHYALCFEYAKGQVDIWWAGDTPKAWRIESVCIPSGDEWVLENHNTWEEVRIQHRIELKEQLIKERAAAPIYTKESYAERLQSFHWRELRREAFRLKGHKCYICGTTEKKLQIHHTSYVNIDTFMEAQDLIPLCEKCHKKVHGGKE